MLATGLPMHTVQLRTARVHGHGDGLLMRQRLEGALMGLDAVAGREFLILRTMHLSGVLPTTGRIAPVQFAAEVRARLQAAMQQARRPWCDASAAGAEAVVFLDEAELIACLLRDGLLGTLTDGWWWQTVLRRRSPSEWCRRVLLQRGDLLPSVVGLLAEKRLAQSWTARMDEQDAGAAIAAVLAAYGLQHLGGLTAADARSSLVAGRVADATKPCCGEPARAVERLWQVVPEARESAPATPGHALLVLALVLARAPAWSRTPEFTKVWRSIVEGRGVVETREESVVAKIAPGEGHRQHVDDPDASGFSHRRQRRSPPPRAKRPRRGSGSENALSLSAVQDAEALSARPATPQAGKVRADANHADGKTAAPRSTMGGEAPPLPENCRAAAVPAALGDDSTPHRGDSASSGDGAPRSHVGTGAFTDGMLVSSDFGGLFYLLNVALALELYGDFTQPRSPGIALSPWDWLALIGLAWFGEAFQRDPVWQVLADLAGHDESVPPGTGYVPPDTWSVPTAWLRPWGEVGILTLTASRHRLQLWHPAGFALLDTTRRRGVAPLRQARAFCVCTPGLRSVPVRRAANIPIATPRHPTANRAVRRWLGLLLAFVEARLRRALGASGDTDVHALVCGHRAKLVCSATCVDVHLSLDALPIEIRLAGLDRDPGWIPAAGRSLAFHFT